MGEPELCELTFCEPKITLFDEKYTYLVHIIPASVFISYFCQDKCQIYLTNGEIDN